MPLQPGQLKPGQLSARYAGHASGPGLTPLVFLHGFTQTGASWGPVLEALDGHFPIILPDAPGHGGSSAVRADLWQTADLLAGLTSSSGTAPGLAAWAGYSMGGRTALHFALAHPEQVASLVLISTSAGIDDAAKRLPSGKLRTKPWPDASNGRAPRRSSPGGWPNPCSPPWRTTTPGWRTA